MFEPREDRMDERHAIIELILREAADGDETLAGKLRDIAGQIARGEQAGLKYAKVAKQIKETP
jgi:hypothetical protein